jgi:hypothetical protein
MLDFNNITGQWGFTLKPAVLDPPFGRSPRINVGCFEPEIKLTLQNLNLDCWEDVDSLRSYIFDPLNPPKIRCPIFWRSGVRATYYRDSNFDYSVYTGYDSAINGVRFYRVSRDLTTNLDTLIPTHSFFRRCWFTGANAPPGGGFAPINPNLPVEWQLIMRPIDPQVKVKGTSTGVLEVDPITLVLSEKYLPPTPPFVPVP